MRNSRPMVSKKSQPVRTFSRLKLYAAVLAASQWMVSGPVWAAPEGGEVVGGEGIIQQAGVETIINQATERMAIDWRSFDVAANERVEFIQPSSSSVALNRVLSNRGSEILGRIDANGQVILVNANGVVFGKDSVVNVGGMIASGLNIDPASFINGDFALNSIEGAEGKVINYGIINAATGGSVTLVGEQVQNDGLISAKLGAVNLVAGKAAVLTFDPTGMVGVRVTEAVVQDELGVDAAVINNGSINAEGGRVLLSASVSEDVFSDAVNNAGMNKSTSVVVHDDGSFTLGAGADVINTGDISTSVNQGNAGQVVLLGDNVTHSGSITANTSSGTGGSVELHSTDTTKLTEDSRISAQASTQGEGGDIKVLGNKVGLFDQTEVNASGANGGGQVLIGGDKTGQNKQVRNADFIYLGKDTKVKTDALINGKGGKLITFASDTARIYGNLYSRGGSEGGNGGFIETSGLKGFEILNTPDITAISGKGGTWLIDPYSISITNENESDDNFLNNGPFTSSASRGPVLSRDSLSKALINGAEVIVQTGGNANDGNGNGDITISNRFGYSINNNQSATLKLLAHGNINVNADIVRDNNNNTGDTNTGTGSLNLELHADSDSSGSGSVLLQSGIKIETQGGKFTADGVNFTTGFGSQNDAQTAILTNGGNIELNFTGAVTLESRVETNGGNFTVVNSGSFNSHFTNGEIKTYGELGGGDIVINSAGNVDLGYVNFGYNWLNANFGGTNPNKAVLLRVGSITIDSGGDVTVHKDIDFNNTGKRTNAGGKGYSGNLLDGDDSFLKIDAFGDIETFGLISDIDYADARDALNIELTAGKNNSSGGDIIIHADIYTAGGNFTSKSTNFNSTGRIINTDRANANLSNTTNSANGNGLVNGNALWSNGGNVTISASDNITLGSITTDGSCTLPNATACTGNLSLSGIDTNASSAGMQSNVAITQTGILIVAGDATFNTGSGTITLENTNNKFNKNLIFTSAGTTSITDFSAISLGTSFVDGNLKLTTGGSITQTGAVAVTGDTEFDAVASVTNYLIDLSLANDFGGKVKATKASSLKLVDINDLSLDAITLVAGATAPNGTIDVSAGATNKIILNGNLNSSAATTKNIIFNSNVEVASNTTINAGTGAISFTGTTNSNDATAKNLTLTGGAITFTGNVGNLQRLGDFKITSTGLVTFADVTAKSFDVSTTNNFTGQNINTSGADSTLAAGEAGGDILISAGSISLASVKASGGKSTATGDHAGGDAGDITLTANSTVSKTITISGDVAAEGGIGSGAGASGAAGAVALTLSGNTVAGQVSLNSNSFLSSSLTVTGSANSGDSLQLTNSNNDWSITSANTGTVKDSGNLVNSPVISFSGIENVTGGTGADNFVIGATGSVTSISGGTGAGVNTLTGRDVNNTWEIGGNNQGVVKAGATTYAQFTNIQNLVGGSLNDYFDFSTATTSAITGSIKGGAGEGAGVLNSLKGRNTASTWVITNLDKGSITGYLASFENIQNLTGGSAADTFNFSAANAAISGKVDGGAAAEKNAIIARTGAPNTWLMTGNEKGSLEVTSPSSAYVNEFDHIQVFTGAGSDTMSFENFGAGTVKVTLGSTGSTGVTSFIGKDNVDAEIVKADGINVWTITGANQGTIKETGFSDISFSKFNTLTGGTGKDTFDFSTVTNSSISGVIDGGGAAEGNVIIARTGTGVKNTWSMTGNSSGKLEQTDGTPETYIGQFTDIQIFTGAGADTMSYATANSGPVIVTLGDAGVTGVNNFVGSTLVDSTIVGENKNNTWIIDGADSGSINSGAVTFSNFKNLSGGSQQDRFTFDTAGSLSGTLDGQNGTDTLIAKDAANIWAFTAANVGNISVGGTTYLANFTNMQVLQGGSEVDTFNLSNNFSGTINGGAGNDVFNINAVVNVLKGEAGNDQFVFSSAANAGTAANIDGGADTNTLIGRVDNNTWTISSQNAGTLGLTSGPLYVTTFTNIQSLTGSTGADIFHINAAITGSINSGAGDNIFNINAAVGDLVGGANKDSFIFLNNGSANSIDGAGGSNTLTGKNSATTWAISLAESGSLTDVASGIAYLNSFSHIQTLQGGSAADTFNLNAVFSGLINGGDGADIFNINAAINELQGGDGNDSFIFSSASNAGVATTIGGGLGTNTLTGRNGDNTWTVASSNSGTLGITGELTRYVNSFSDIQILNGGTGNDIFILNNLVSGSINAGAGTNTFNVNAAVGALTGGDGDDNFIFGAAGSATTVNGGIGNNQITARDGLNTWNLSAVNGGSLQVTGGANYINTFSNIQTLFGGNNVDIFNINQSFTGSLYGGLGDDSFRFTSANNAGSVSLIDGGAGVNNLMGRNEANIWTITAANTGTLGLNPGNLYVTDFSNIQSLIGGSAADTFVINAAVNNTIDAGSGNNIFNINAAVGSLVGGDGNDRFVFGGSGSANSIDGAGGSNTLQAKDIANIWTLTADNQGALASAGVNYVSLFSNIQTLQGGSNTDLFNLNFRFNGAIRGGAGNDSFVVNAQVNQLFGEDDNDSFIFSSANNQGSASLINGGAGVNSLAGRNAANTWTVSSLDAGSLGITNAPTYVTSFTSIQTLNGGSDADTFVINANVSNGIFAGAGNNIFNVNTLVGSLTGGVDNDRFIFDAAGSANSIDGGAGTNTLVGRNSANTWVLTAANTGSLGVTTGATYVSGFSNIQVLQGGNAVDTFDLKFAFSGTVNGGADNDIFNIDAVVNLLQGEDGNDSFLFSSDANAGTAATIDGGSGNNSLTSRNQDNTWTISGQNTGTLALTAGANYVTEFKNIQTLNGGTGADNFIINAAVNNAINAGAGDNTFTINADVGDISGGAGNDSFVFGESGRANSVSGGGGINSLVGRNGLNTWEISGADQGRLRVTNGVLYVNSFNDIQTLQGGSSVDIFNINSSYAGTIKGGAGDDSFNIFASANQLYGEADNDSFILIGQSSSVTTLDGGVGSNNLTGRNAANTWQITSANSGNLGLTNGATYVSAFSNIQNIFGGNAVDIFQINAAIASVNGGNGNDEFRINAAAGNLYGNDDDDQFIFSSADNAGSATLIDGGNGQNQILGRNTTNTWSITTTNAGKLSVTGGPAYVSSFNNIQTLIGGNLADIFDINANVTNSINAGNGDNIFNIYTTVGDLLGGADNDQFAFGTNGRANSVNGGGGTNTLTARDADNRWTIVSSNAGNIATTSNDFYVNNFSNIQILNGGNAVDTFIIQSSAATILGNEGNDVFEFANNGVANLIDGGVGTNTLKGRNQDSIWTMVGANSGNVSTTAASTYVAAFANIQNLVGGSGADTLAAINQANSWTIKQSNKGTLNATAAPTDFINFEGMENLLGNQGVDLFSFEANGYITGLIDGGTSATQNTIKDSLDLSAVTGNLTVELGAQQSAALNVLNVEDITASTSNQDNHVLLGASDVAYRWRITAQNQGYIEHAVDPLLETSVNFFNFGDLRGGTNSDRFDVQGSITKSIDGGSGIDLVDYSQRKENFVIVLGGSGGLGNTGISGIEGVVGNSASGNGFTSTIQVNSGDNIWEIGASSSFGDGINDGSITINNNKVSFENFTNLVGGSGNDTFKYIENGQWIGNIDGGGGNNIIDASLSIKDQQFVVNGTALNAGTNLKNVGQLIANANTNSSLISTLQSNIWQIDNQGVGHLNNNLNFINIANLQGGGFVDVFSFANISWLKGTVDGGGGIDTVNLIAMDRAIQVAVDAQTDADINLLNIETINANNNFSNTLKGDFNGNEWHINAANAGVLNKKINFTGFANLTGSAFADVVVFDNSAATLSGHLDLGDGLDTLDLSASDRDVTVQLNSSKAALASGVLSVDKIEVIKGDADQSNRLVGDNFTNTWTLDDVNSGRIAAVETGTVTFTQFKHISGGNKDDLFVFEALGRVTGLVDGGGQAVRDSVDLSKSNNANVVITTTGESVGFTNVEKYVGNNVDSTLTAANIINNWSLTGANRGTLNEAIEFENFGVLKGGNKQDNFVINNATISGSIDSGDGDDTFDIRASAIAGKIKAGAGDDRFTFTIAPGAVGTADIDAGEGANRLTIEGGDADYKVSHQLGRHEYASAAGNTYSILYSNVLNVFDNVLAKSLSIFGTTTADTFRLLTGRYNINNLSTVNYTNKSNLIVNGTADDQVIVDGTVGIESTVTFNNLRVLAENAGKIQAQSLELVNTGSVGSATARLNTAVNDLSLSATNGAVYLDEQDALVFKNFNVSTTELVDIKAGGNLTSAGSLTYTGNLNLESSRGNIDLGNNNSLAGIVSLKAAGNITLDNLQALSLGDLVAQNATLGSSTNIKGLGVFSVAGLATLNAGGEISLLNANNDINQITVARATKLDMFDSNGFTTVGLNVTNDVNLRSSGGIILSTSCTTDCNNTYGINTKNLKIQSGAGVTVAKSIAAADSVNIESQGLVINDSITSKQFTLNALNGKLTLNDSGNLLGQEGTGIELTANNIEQRAKIVSGGNVKVNAAGDVTMTDAAVMESVNGDIVLNGNNLQLATLNATKGSTTITAQGIVANKSITSKQISLNAGNGKIVLNTDGNLLGQEGTGIELAANTIEQHSKIISGGNLKVAATGDIIMFTSAEMESLNGNIVIDGNNLQLAALKSINGSTTTTARGAIKDGNGNATNITAIRWQADAINGIGSGLGDAASADAIETNIDVLSVRNAGSFGGAQGSNINIANTKALKIEQLANNGDISISNLGDIVLDNTNSSYFDSAKTDARAQGGVINSGAGSATGGQLLLTISGGMVRAENGADAKNPDIIANIATFKYNSSFDFGERNRKIVMHIPEVYNQNARLSFVKWYEGIKPKVMNDLSKVPSDSIISGRDQLIQIEGLSEIDPAIFTNLRNYVHDEVAILLPVDQRFDDSEDL